MLSPSGVMKSLPSPRVLQKKLTQDLSKFTAAFVKRSRTTRGHRQREKEKKLSVHKRQVSIGERHAEGILLTALLAVVFDRLTWTSLWLYAKRKFGGVHLVEISDPWVHEAELGFNVLSIVYLPGYILLAVVVLGGIVVWKSALRSFFIFCLLSMLPIASIIMWSFSVWYLVFLHKIQFYLTECYPELGPFSGTNSGCHFGGEEEENVWNLPCTRSGSATCFVSSMEIYNRMRRGVYFVILTGFVVCCLILMDFMWSLNWHSAILAERRTRNQRIDDRSMVDSVRPDGPLESVADLSPIGALLSPMASPARTRRPNRLASGLAFTGGGLSPMNDGLTRVGSATRLASPSFMVSPRLASPSFMGSPRLASPTFMGSRTRMDSLTCMDSTTRMDDNLPPSSPSLRRTISRHNNMRSRRVRHSPRVSTRPRILTDDIPPACSLMADVLWGSQLPPRKESQISQHSL